jgi:hypothetical protein
LIFKSKAIPIRLSIEAYEAYIFLKDKPVNRSKLICQGGEKALIYYAEKYKLNSRVKKIKPPF